jgi:hypothetical protein
MREILLICADPCPGKPAAADPYAVGKKALRQQFEIVSSNWSVSEPAQASHGLIKATPDPSKSRVLRVTSVS